MQVLVTSHEYRGWDCWPDIVNFGRVGRPHQPSQVSECLTWRCTDLTRPRGALVWPVEESILSKSGERYYPQPDETNFSIVHLYQCTFSFKIRCLSAWM